jgi:hypothetical protein
LRDEHGRYQALKAITDNGPDWSSGCDHCKYGLVDAPPLLIQTETFVMERLAQMLLGMLQFCTCRAGAAQEAYLTHKRWSLVNEALKDPRMVDQAKRRTHVDIENAMHAVVKAMETPAPTIHFQEELVTA